MKFKVTVRSAEKAALLLVLIFILSCAAKNMPEPAHGPHEDYGARAEIVVKDLSYVQGVNDNKNLMLDVYSNPHDGLWPVAVMIHGGAWMKGDKSMSNKIYNCKVMAANGYVTFTINYRLAPAHKVKRQIEDAMAAVIWVKEHAREYGGDPERIGVMGGSAGGHIAAMVAWASDDPYFVPTGNPRSRYDSDVDAAALYYPVLDIDETLGNALPVFTPIVRLYLAGKITKKQMQRISPHNYIDENDPPTLFLTGDADELELYPQSVMYEKKLLELGVPSKLFTAPGKKHAFTWQYWEPESVASAHEIVKFFDAHVK